MQVDFKCFSVLLMCFNFRVFFHFIKPYLTNFMYLMDQFNKKVVCKDWTNDFFSLFPFLSLFHKNSIFDKHFKWGCYDICFNVSVLVGIFIEFFDEVRVYEFENSFMMNVANRDIKMRINFFKRFDSVSISLPVFSHHVTDTCS